MQTKLKGVTKQQIKMSKYELKMQSVEEASTCQIRYLALVVYIWSRKWDLNQIMYVGS